MKKIETQEVSKIAALARLEADRATLERFAGQLDNILEYMETLNELNTANVDPLYSPVQHPTPFREDVVHQEYTQQDILENAPESDEQYFIVPKII